MNLSTYSKIVGVVKNHKGMARDCLEILKKVFPQESDDTLYSIVSLEHQRRMKVNYNKSEATKNKFWNLYRRYLAKGEAPGIILRLAEEAGVSPCLVAKLIVQKYYEHSGEPQNYININTYLKDTSIIQDMHLSYEVFLCTMYDILYSPLAETMKHSLGQQYEIQLLNTIKGLGLAFRDEEQLRRTGYDKTPDIKLEVPVSMDGFIVNWIESKALFGDELVHKEYTKNQYLSYWNRFGSGLIIYWFGFVETIVEPSDKRFLIRTSVPTENILYIVPPKNKTTVTANGITS